MVSILYKPCAKLCQEFRLRQGFSLFSNSDILSALKPQAMEIPYKDAVIMEILKCHERKFKQERIIGYHLKYDTLIPPIITIF